MLFKTTAKSSRSLLLALPAILLPIFLTACASDADVDLATYVEQTDPADVLYNQCLANLETGRLKEAAA